MTFARAPERAHPPFSASGATRWLGCNASVPYSEQLMREGRIPVGGTSSKFAERGTLIHSLLARAIELDWEVNGGVGAVSGHWRTDRLLKDGRASAPADVDWNEAVRMADAMHARVDEFLAGRYGDGWATTWRTVEQRMDISEPMHLGGTADLIQFMEGQCEAELMVLDFKSGAMEVPAERNAQLMIYAYLALRNKMDGYLLDGLPVRLVIVQPGDYGLGAVALDEWETTAGEVIHFVEVECLAAYQAAHQPDPPFAPEYARCRYCPARAHCPAIHEMAASYIGDPSMMKTMTDEQIAEFYSNARVINLAMEEVKVHVRAGRITGGGFETRPGAVRRSWHKDKDGREMEHVLRVRGNEAMYSLQLKPIKELDAETLELAIEVGAVVEKQNVDTVVLKNPFEDKELMLAARAARGDKS